MSLVSRCLLAIALLAVPLLVPGLPAFCAMGAETNAPNIVLILSDDQAWTDYGFMGHEVIRTPNLDKLAARSACFTRGHVPTALCRPSLATIITGLYAHQHGIVGNDPARALAKSETAEYAKLREKLIGVIDRLPTVPKLLAPQGYRSFQSGKWWEGSFERGGFTHGMTKGFPNPGGRHGDVGLKIGRDGLKPALDFIDRSVAEKKPFFLWYAPIMPHTPHDPPERLLAKYRDKTDSIHTAKYHAMCEWFDETCGELIDHIEKQGQTSNTLFVYLADNGWVQDPKSAAFVVPSKQSPYEAGVRQPIMLSWPGVIRPGKREDLVSSIDIAPTMLSAAGVKSPENLPGIDLLPYVREGRPITRDVLFGETFCHDIADLDQPEASLLHRWTIEGRWKLLLTYDGPMGRYATIPPHLDKGPQLFDLHADPREEKNLAAEQPEVVARLNEKIEGWWKVNKSPLKTAGK